MIMPQGVPRKRYGLFVLAVLVLLSGGMALAVGSHDYTIRSLGLVAVLASTYLLRISNVHTRSASPVASRQGADFKPIKSPGRLVWAVGVALVPILGVSFRYLYNDAVHGGHTALPVYVFAGVIVACASFWSYLLSRILR